MRVSVEINPVINLPPTSPRHHFLRTSSSPACSLQLCKQGRLEPFQAQRTLNLDPHVQNKVVEQSQRNNHVTSPLCFAVMVDQALTSAFVRHISAESLSAWNAPLGYGILIVIGVAFILYRYVLRTPFPPRDLKGRPIPWIHPGLLVSPDQLCSFRRHHFRLHHFL